MKLSRSMVHRSALVNFPEETSQAISLSKLAIFPKIVWPGLIVSLFVFALCAYSAFFLYRHKVFNQENVIFGADPYYRSVAFSEGWGERSLIHPNLSNFVNPPVRVVGALLQPLRRDLAPRELRMQISLCVSPLFSGLAAFMIYVVGALAGLNVRKAVTLSLLFGFSMSTIAFGSVPDHFLISAFVLSASVWLIQWHAKVSDPWRLRAWALLGTAAAGITISNAVPLLAVFGFSEWVQGGRLSQAISRAVTIGFVVGGATLAFWGIANWFYGDFSALRPDHAYSKNIGRIGYHLSDDPARDFVSFPVATGQAFAGGFPKIVPTEPYPKPEIASYNLGFSYGSSLSQLGSLRNFVVQLVPFILIAFSVYLAFRYRNEATLPVEVGIVVYLAFNWLLHTFWGEELFLFSPHWHFASVLALIPLLRTFTGRISISLVCLSAVLVAGFNLSVWRETLMLLPTLALR